MREIEIDANSRPYVFISYTHDSPQHKDRVYALADRLESDGIRTRLDRDVEAPAQGWPRWMVEQVEQSAFIVVVVTETWARRAHGDLPDGGRSGLGARWEGLLVMNRMYTDRPDRCIPVALQSRDVDHIPLWLRQATYYDLSSPHGYERLRRHLSEGVLAEPQPRPGTNAPARELPKGAVTFVFTDIEGSTRLVQELKTDRWHELLIEHARVIRSAVMAHDGVEVRTAGDGFFLVFRRAYDAIAAAADVQRVLAAQPWARDINLRVRMGMHTSERAVPASAEAGADYVGYDVHRAARISAAAHGGQVLVSSATTALLGAELPPGITLRDLGGHRLKDLAEADRLYQAVIEGVADTFPPIRSLSQGSADMPIPLTSFVGRLGEIEELVPLVARTRLLTLIGPGGTGKTRLAVEVAKRATDLFDGTFFVPLAALSDSGLVLPTIARALDVQEAGSRPILESLTTTIAQRRLLVVIDNFEHVIDAASGLADLLKACPALHLLVTSRSALRLSGEREFQVSPLRVPAEKGVTSPDQIQAFDSVALFVDRAQAVRRSFALTSTNAAAVAAICARLDGLPLAIELAAVRIRGLSADQIAARLEDRLSLLGQGQADLSERHRTLRDTVAWSYDLLDPTEQLLFRRLGVFAGGWSIAAAEAVCGSGTSVSVVDGLDSLIGKSLMRLDEDIEGRTRYRMLQTIREFSKEQLGSSNEAQRIASAHAAYYLGVAESQERRLEGPQQVAAVRTLEEERENLRAALAFYLDANSFDSAARLAGALGWFWWLRGYLGEGRSWVERALGLPGASARTALRGKILNVAGMLASQQQDFDTARQWLKEAVAIRRELGDGGGVAESLHFLGDAILTARTTARAGRLYEEGAELAVAADRLVPLTALRVHLGIIAVTIGDHDRARVILEDTLKRAHDAANPWAIGICLLTVGFLKRAEGDPAAARADLRSGLSLLRDIGDRFALMLGMMVLAATLADLGDAIAAVRLAGAVEAETERIGNAPPESMYALVSASIDSARAGLGHDHTDEEHAVGRGMTIDGAIDYALHIAGER